jgi:hypothetical protein
MGRQLSKLHQTHFCLSARAGYLQYPHHDSVPHPPVPSTQGTGFVSKKDRLEKADRQPIPAKSGSKIPYLLNHEKKSL